MTGQVVAVGEVTGLPGVDTLHSVPIEAPFVRVMVKQVIDWNYLIPVPNKEEKLYTLKDVNGLNILWNARFLRKG